MSATFTPGEQITLEGQTFRTFESVIFGQHVRVFCRPTRYSNNDTLAIEVLELHEEIPDPIDILDEEFGPSEFGNYEPFGILTVNLQHPVQSATGAFVKNYSENTEWAEPLAKAIGAKETGITCWCGHVDVPLYDFSEAKF